MKPQVRPVPRCWLMTDARIGAALPAIAAKLPPRSAIIIRRFAMEPAKRDDLIRRLRRAARARRHLFLWSGPQRPVGYDGRHSPIRGRDNGFLVMPVHNQREAMTARQGRANAVLISPVRPTRSHPGAAVLGIRGFRRLAANREYPAIALGGMDGRIFRRLRIHGAHGWAAIDAWMTIDR